MIFMKARSGAIHLALAIVGAAGFGQVVKHLFHRARPDVAGRLIEVSGFSYPSGHSVGASAFYVTLCLLSFQYFRKSHERVTLFMICFGMIFLIGFSRVYLGVHYPSDVFSGICLGAGWALLLQSISSWMDSTN
jgi:undecaprenyl-diphosphatase